MVYNILRSWYKYEVRKEPDALWIYNGEFQFGGHRKGWKVRKKEKKERGQTCGITVVNGVQLVYMILIIDRYIVPLYRYESVFPDVT